MIKLICVGKIKDDFYVKAVNEYAKRLSSFTKFEIVEVKEVCTSDINKNILQEGENILKVISDTDYCITLEIEGKMLDSIELSKELENILNHTTGNICFIIGGSNGLSLDVKKRSNFKLSFSKMTFPHQLMRVIFSEQLYRAFTIIHHKEYHK